MCGRFTLRTPASQLVQQFLLDVDSQLTPRFNIAPTQRVAAVRQQDGARQLVGLRWGMIPSWTKDASVGSRMINARGETVASKPSFRSALKRRRCLVLADGYYEWKKEGSQKQPYFIRLRDDQPFAFAGLWEAWQDPMAEKGDPPWETCTIITTDANELSASIHDRMPVILDAADHELWLDPDLQEAAPLQPLLRPYPSGEMTADPVSTHVNKPAHDDPRCVEIQRTLFD